LGGEHSGLPGVARFCLSLLRTIGQCVLLAARRRASRLVYARCFHPWASTGWSRSSMAFLEQLYVRCTLRAVPQLLRTRRGVGLGATPERFFDAFDGARRVLVIQPPERFAKGAHQAPRGIPHAALGISNVAARAAFGGGSIKKQGDCDAARQSG